MDLSSLALAPSVNQPSALIIVDPEPALEQTTLIPPPPCCSQVDDHSATTLTDTAPSHFTAPAFLDFILPPAACESYSISTDKESTTLCSHAYILIAHQNFQGLNENTIWNWLDQGFRRARCKEESCRVENRLLFGLLDFNSGA